MQRTVATAVFAAALAAFAIMPSWAAAAPGTVTDQQAGFLAGTPGSATRVVNATSVELAPVRQDFDGAELPAGLSSTPWQAGGGTTVADGALSVDGARIAGDTFVGAGHSLQFRATFGDTPFQHVGFGDTFEDAPWAMFSTGGGALPTGLYARVATADGNTTDVAIPDVDPTVPHTYRIDWQASRIDFYVDGDLVDFESVSIDDDMREVISDFAPDGTPLSLDWLERPLYVSSGVFESRVLDAGDARATWGFLNSYGSGDIAVVTRTGNTPAPDASWSDFAAVGAAGEIRSPAGRYIQYRATLTTADTTATPALAAVAAGYDVPPTTRIDGVDVAGTTITARFSSDGGLDIDHFECRLDGGTFSACASGDRFTALGQGAHTVAVRVVDIAGNAGPAASRSFTIDTIPPTVAIDPVQVAGNAATVSFSSADTDVAGYECRLDGGAFAACATGKQYAGLADGTHTVSVHATDTSGNVGTASRDFTVDTTPPTVSISSLVVAGSAATVSFASPDSDVDHFECRLDDGAFAACATGRRYTGLGDGHHTVAVRATDKTGNSGTADSRDFTVDTTPPTVAVDPVQVAGNAATVSFSSADTDVAGYECRLDGGAFAACTTGKQYSGLADGTHTVTVHATDTSGNVGTVSRDFTVDTTPPTVAISGVDVSGNGATVSFTSADADVDHYQCRLDDGAFAACATGQQYTGLDDGHHTVAVRATDKTGNTGTADSRDFTIDTTGPTVTIRGVAVSGTAATVAFSSADADVARYECRLDGAAAFTACATGQRFSGLAAGVHTVDVRGVDRSGNTGAAASSRFVIAAPVPSPPPAAPPTNVDHTVPHIGLTVVNARPTRSGLVRLTVACPATETNCTVTVRLTQGGLVLARKSVTVAGGASRTISLRLSAAAGRRLARAHRLRATIAATARDAAGNTGTTTKRLTLRSSRR